MVIPRIEVSIKENLEKHANSTTRYLIGESFKENFNNHLAPAFDHSCRELFEKLAEVMENGYKQQQNVIQHQLQVQDEGSGSTKEGMAVAMKLVKLAEKLGEAIVSTQEKLLKDYEKGLGEGLEDQEEDESYHRSAEQSKEVFKDPKVIIKKKNIKTP